MVEIGAAVDSQTAERVGKNFKDSKNRPRNGAVLFSTSTMIIAFGKIGAAKEGVFNERRKLQRRLRN